jgi:hypothetical protein
MSKSRKISSWLLSVIAAIGIIAATVIYAGQQPSIIQQGVSALQTEGVMDSVQQQIVESTDNMVVSKTNDGNDVCYQMCQANMQYLNAALLSLDTASGAVDSGDTITAKAELGKAKTLLTAVKQSMDKYMGRIPVSNSICPITGKPVDPNLPQSHTRMYKGKKIGFSAPACALVWDTLSDSEKDDKLKESTPPETAPTEKPSIENLLINILKKNNSDEK